MTCISPRRETPTYVFSNKNGIIGSNFLCIISFRYTATFRKGWNQNSHARGLLGVWNVVKSPYENFGTVKPLKIVNTSISVQKIQHFSKTCLLTAFF